MWPQRESPLHFWPCLAPAQVSPAGQFLEPLVTSALSKFDCGHEVGRQGPPVVSAQVWSSAGGQSHYE